MECPNCLARLRYRAVWSDETVLGADPSADVTAFAKVRYTIRGGRVVYKAPTKVEGRSGLVR